jgi:aryl-alcohol dehydrogenase-like predicted oxidoreductase
LTEPNRLATMAPDRDRGAVERRRVGTTDLQLSVVGLGGAWLGHDSSDPSEVSRASAVLRAAHETGVNWVDTSENYFDTGNESVIGVGLREMPASFLVCSKVAPGAHRSGGGSGFRPAQVRRACEMSLRRLGRDRLDLYLLHWPDESGVPLEDTWGAMAALVTDGLVRTIGLSNYDREDISRCHQQRPVDVIQTGLNLLDYLDDRAMISWCGEQGIAVTIFDALASGILTDTPFEQARARWVGTPWEDWRLFSSENADRTGQVVDGLHEIARQIDATTAQAAIAWVLRQPGVTSALAGTRSPDRARDNGRAADVALPDAALQAIDDLIPLGPAAG